MRTLTRTLLTIGAMLIGVAAVAAQPPSPHPAVLVPDIRTEARSAQFVQARSPSTVIERLMSFDVDADHRISRDELPERMQGLVARGDKNADAALDSEEVRALVNASMSGPLRVSFRSQPSEGLPGVVRDLKLPPDKYASALVIVENHKPPRSTDDPVSSALLGEMKALLDEEDYENFVAAATRLSRSGDLRFRGVGGVVRGVVKQEPR